jgi:hypothetical protein
MPTTNPLSSARLSLIAALLVPAHNAIGQLVSTDTVVNTARARQHIFHSRLNGRDYRLWVALPPAYSPVDTRYPVLYVLDGAGYFPIATAMHRRARPGADSVILVGVGHVNPAGEARMADYTLPLTPRSGALERGWQAKGECCGAARTIRVFREEIVPFIDSAYRTTTDRGLFGHSHTGLFAAYVLFTDPDLLSRYAITSPALWWDRREIFALEAEFARSSRSLAKRVYLSVGSLEQIDLYESAFRMIATLRARNYEGLDLVAEELAGAQHGSLAEFSRMLDVLYPRMLAADTNGTPADREAARGIVQAFLADFARRDARSLDRYLVRDSSFRAVVGDRIIHGTDDYISTVSKRFGGGPPVALTVDTLRIMSEDPGTNSAIADVTLTAMVGSRARERIRSRIMFELAPSNNGWRIVFVMHDLPAAPPVTTIVMVRDDRGLVSDATVRAVGDQEFASARTDASGAARLPYDWHVPRRGHIRVTTPRHETAVLPLPASDTVIVMLKRKP